MSGEVVTAALMNTHIRDNELYLYDSGSFIREGGNIQSGSMTSTIATDMLVVNGISIAPTRPITIMVSFRKQTSGGAAVSAGCGLKVDGTIISEASSVSNDNVGFGAFSSTSTAEVAFSQIWVSPRLTNYVRTSFGEFITSDPTGSANNRSKLISAESSSWPTTTTTSIIIRGKTGSLSCTLFVDQVHIYSMSGT